MSKHLQKIEQRQLPDILTKNDISINEAYGILTKKEAEVLFFRNEMTINEMYEQDGPFTEVINNKSVELEVAEWVMFKVGMTLDLCFEMVGISKDLLPSTEVSKMMAWNVITNYPYLSVQDLMRAFNMAATEKLHVKVDTYNVPPSIQFVERILRAYNTWKYQKNLKIDEKLLDFKIDYIGDHLKGRPLSDRAVKDTIINEYANYIVEKSVNILLIRSEYYDFMCDIGIVDLTKEELIEASHRANTHHGNDIIHNGRLKNLTDEVVNKTLRSLKNKYAILIQYKKWRKSNFSVKDLDMAFDKACFLSPKSHYTLHTLMYQYNEVYRQFINQKRKENVKVDDR